MLRRTTALGTRRVLATPICATGASALRRRSTSWISARLAENKIKCEQADVKHKQAKEAAARAHRIAEQLDKECDEALDEYFDAFDRTWQGLYMRFPSTFGVMTVVAHEFFQLAVQTGESKWLVATGTVVVAGGVVVCMRLLRPITALIVGALVGGVTWYRMTGAAKPEADDADKNWPSVRLSGTFVVDKADKDK